MYTSKSDYDEVRAIFRTRKQKEAFYTVLFCWAGILLTLICAALWQWAVGS